MIEQLRLRNEQFERWMYANGRPNRLARFLNGCWALAGRAGIWRSRLVTLEVAGRASGRSISFPLVVVRESAERYLVAMLGERAQWVRNVRAAGGRAVLWDGGRRQEVLLEEVEQVDRAAIMRRYAELAPGGRSFIPVDFRTADADEFANVAGQFPVFRVRVMPATDTGVDTAAEAGTEAGIDRPAGTSAAQPQTTGAQRPRRRRRRWAIGSLVVVGIVVALAFGSVGAYLQSSATPALALPAHVSAPTGTLEGAWIAGEGSIAGFRIDQTVFGMTGNVAGRTNAVGGSATISGGEVASAAFRIDLTTIRSKGRPVEQFDKTLETSTYPAATFTLTQPIAFASAFVSGDAMSTTAPGTLSLHGQTRLVTAHLSARRDGAAIDVAGTIPVSFADWGIDTPAGFGWFGSLADHGDAEFLLVLDRASA